MKMLLALFRFLAWLVPRLPVRLSYRLAEIVGDVLWLLARNVRADVEKIQRHALGSTASEREVALSSREAMRNLAKCYIDEFRTPALCKEEIRQLVIVEGMEHLEEALRRGNGAIFVSAHYGAPQVLGQFFVSSGIPTAAAVEHIEPEELLELLCSLRGAHGMRVVPTDSSMLALVRTLRRENGVLGLALDRNVTHTGIRMPFLGEEALVPDGAVRLALRTGAALIVTYCLRRPDFSYRAVLEPPVFLDDPSADVDTVVEQVLAHLVERVEVFLRARPSEWVLTVPIWLD